MPTPPTLPPLMLLAFEDERGLAEPLAAALGCELGFVTTHRFPDGELKLALPAALPARLVVLRGLHRPNEKLLALLLLARTARELGAREIALVAPYLAYMRQDMAFTPGEAISQRIVGRFLADLFDMVVTVDPHLHRVATLDEVMPGKRGIALSAAPLLGDFAARHAGGAAPPVLVAPDEEAAQWVSAAAAAHGFETAVCKKVRNGDRDVAVALPDIDITGRAVVLIDDVASSGHTLAEAAAQLKARGAASIDVAVTHALFFGDAMALLKASGVRHIWSTDCVPHETNVVSVVPLLSAALVEAWAGDRDQALP